ncbi:hypothetical protein ACYOEI_15695 [Singulisphaera rosea]
MEEMLIRGWEQLVGRATGALHFRFILQPLVASFFAIRSGLRDAREGRPAFLWTLVLNSPQRRTLLRQLWTDVGKLFFVAVVLDVIYQATAFHWFYPGLAMIVAATLAVVPYLLVRGLTNRIARLMGLK